MLLIELCILGIIFVVNNNGNLYPNSQIGEFPHNQDRTIPKSEPNPGINEFNQEVQRKDVFFSRETSDTPFEHYWDDVRV